MVQNFHTSDAFKGSKPGIKSKLNLIERFFI
jgi:hypothetical protein